MSKMMHISEIYAAQLEELARGYPLWFPDGQDDEGEVEIGDVGYIYQGSFAKLFNAGYTADDPHNAGKSVPEGHKPFSWTGIQYHTQSNDMDPGPYSSKSIQHKKIAAKGGAGVPNMVGAGASYEFSVADEKGALLYLTHNARQRSVRTGQKIIDYLSKHYAEWYKQARRDGHTIRGRELVLVQGHVKTVEWTVAAVRSVSTAHSASVEAQAGFQVVGNVSFEWSSSSSVRGSVESRTGPKRRTNPSRSPSPIQGPPEPSPFQSRDQLSLHSRHSSLAVPQLPSPAPSEAGLERYDQCIFLRYYKVKWRLGPFVLKAGAGPHQLPSDRDEEADIDIQIEPDEEIETNPPESSIYSSVDVVLDYILENSNAEVAIASHDDIDSLLLGLNREQPIDLAEFLRQHCPPIDENENGVGTLSLVDLIMKERVHDITSVPTSRVNLDELIDADERDDDEDDDDDEHRNNGGLSFGKLTLGNRLDGSPIKWPHLAMKDKQLDAGSVSSTAISPDGKLIAAGFDDPTVRVWNSKGGGSVKLLEGHNEAVWSVAFSPDGTRLVTGSADAKALVWDLQAEELEYIIALQGHTADVSMALYSPNGKYIATGSVDCTVKIWDPEAPEDCLQTLKGHSTNVMHLAFTRDTARIISCAEGVGKIWDVATGEQIGSMVGHDGAIWCLAVSNDGDRVATGSEDHTCRVWDSTSGVELVTIAEHTGPLWSVAWSPDDKSIVSGSYDATGIISDSYSGETQHILSRNNDSAIIDAVAWSPIGGIVCSGSADGYVRLWDTNTGGLTAEYHGHQDKVKQIMFAPDGRDVISSSDDGSIRKWSVVDPIRLA